MDKFETSPPVRDISERSFCTQYGKPILIALGIIVTLVVIGGIVYYFVTQEPDFDESDANSMVDQIFRHDLDKEIPICDHSIIILKFNHSSRFHRKKGCVKTWDKHHSIPGVDFPYHERNFTCEVRGVNVNVLTENKYSHEPCRYDGNFFIDLAVSNKTSRSNMGGNSFKVIHLKIASEEKTDYSRRLRKLVKGFSWLTGQKIASHAKDKFINKYGHEDYTSHDVGFDEFEDPELCLHFWPCPTTPDTRD